MRISLAGDLCLTEPPPQPPPDYRTVFQTDIVVANLEGPLSTNTDPLPKVGPSLSMPSSSFDAITAAGISAVSLANNHIFDFGRPGLRGTLHKLEEKTITHFGAGLTPQGAAAPAALSEEHGGIAIMGFAEREWNTDGEAGANIFDPVSAYRSINSASRLFQHVIVVVHGGNEHISVPSPKLLDQLSFLIEGGAAAVILHHSHRVGGVVSRDGRPIFAGVGNFFFPMAGATTPWNLGLVAHLEFQGKRVRPSHDFVRFDETSWPLPLSESEAAHESERFACVSAILNNAIEHERSWSQEIQPFAESYLAWLATSPGSGRASQLIRQAQARYLLRRMPMMLRQWRSLLATPAHHSAALAALDWALAKAQDHNNLS